MMGAYFCSDGTHFPKGGHDMDNCVVCLRTNRDAWRRKYAEDINVDLVERMRQMDRRISRQRVEIAKLTTSNPSTPVKINDAYRSWEIPGLLKDRHSQRLAWIAFESGWKAARRAIFEGKAAPEPIIDIPVRTDALQPSTIRAFGGCGVPDPKDGVGCCQMAGHHSPHDHEQQDQGET